MADLELKDVIASVDGVNTAFEEFKKTNDEILAAKLDGKAVDVLLEEKLAAINADMSKHQETLDAHILATKRNARGGGDNKSAADLDAEAKGWIAGATGDRSRTATGDQMVDYKSAFEAYMRKGDQVMVGDEAKALSVGSDADGGFQVHPDMSGQVATRVFETSAMRAYASVQTISTDALEGTVDDDEAGAEWVGETQTRSETTTPQLGVWRIPVHELSAKPKATQKILDDAQINMEAWLSGKVADKFARAENTAFVTGTGIAQPRGFLTYDNWATAGTYERGAIEQFDTGVNGGFAAAPNGGDVLIEAIMGLKAQYRANANWFMNRSTTEAVRKLKDSDGAYLWAPGIAAGQPASLLGYAQASFEDMPDPATGSLSLAFGDMRTTYQIVDRMGIRVLRDPYTDQPFVVFVSTKRTGGDVVNFEAMKLIKMAA